MAKEKYFKQPSVMSHQEHFSKAPSVDIERSKFNRSCAYKSTFDAGGLVPVFVDEVLPGDTFQMKSTSFTRLATPLKPVMDNMYTDMHFFFVPNRLVWENWQKFMGERDNPDDDPNDYTVPQYLIDIPSDAPSDLTIEQYFGLPYRGATPNQISVSALPFRAMNLIWNEWYRDQNLQDSVPVPTGDGPDAVDSYGPLPRNKRYDYITSCLPWPQKGDPVTIPIGDSAPVTGIGLDGNTVTSNTANFRETGANSEQNATGWGVNLFLEEDPDNPGFPGVFADLSSATSVTINDLRLAFQIQTLLERDARGGTRYIEIILAHFGVRSDDARLQRPEYLGGGTNMININPVAATATVTSAQPQGQLAGVGTGVNTARFKKSFTEHGFIIGFISARADLTYQRGIERFWSRRTRYDYYWPALAHIGEQAVLNQEVNYTGQAEDTDTFGYQERYAEYRYKPSRITGLFNSDWSTPLDVWHLAQNFDLTPPALDGDFITEQPPIGRIKAVVGEPDFLLDVWFELECDRPMPLWSIPGLGQF